jgi:hypothetical protein
MNMSDSFLSNAGWLFFGIWTAIIFAVGILAFGSDLLPARAKIDSAQKSPPIDLVRSKL